VLNPIQNNQNQQTQWKRCNAPKSLTGFNKTGHQMQNRELKNSP
jgi:hypothetical protein